MISISLCLQSNYFQYPLLGGKSKNKKDISKQTQEIRLNTNENKQKGGQNLASFKNILLDLLKYYYLKMKFSVIICDALPDLVPNT